MPRVEQVPSAAAPGSKRRWRVEFHAEQSRGSSRYRYAAVVIGLAVSTLVAVLTAPGSASLFFEQLWNGTFGTPIGIQTLLTLATPLIFTGLAAGIPYRAKLWNIGADGQMILGAWAAALIAFTFPHMAGPPLIILMLLGSLVGGALWMLLPAIGRAWLGINEILTTLLLNFVAGFWLIYFGGKVWLAQESAGGVNSKPIPTQSHLPNIEIGSVQVPLAFIIGVVLALAIWAWIRYSRFGYELSVMSSSESTASYAGISVKRRTVVLLLIGGALAGMGGATVMMGSLFQFGQGIASTGVASTPGYTGIVIAILAAGSEVGILLMSVVFGVILAGSNILLVGGASANLLPVMLGVTLVIAAIGQGLGHMRLVRVGQKSVGPGPRRAPGGPEKAEAST